MTIETVRVSQRAKQQLIKLKRNTGISNWNVLCRWAFCLSLAEHTIPPDEKIVADSNVEMTWRTFGGKEAELYMALLKMRCHEDGLPLDDESLGKYFKLHLHRGISYLAGDKNIKSVSDLLKLLCNTDHENGVAIGTPG